MQVDQAGWKQMQRADFLAEKNHIQTSLHSKKQQDALEHFRRRLRHEKLMDTTLVNRQQKANLDVQKT